MGFEIKSLLIWFAMAFGITAPLPEFVGGMIVGLAAAYASMIFTPPESRLSLGKGATELRRIPNSNTAEAPLLVR